jgi:hypothetical protein
LLTVTALLLACAPSFAQSCIDDVWKAHGNSQNLTCTANDVRVASATNIRDLSNATLTQCVSGQYFSFVADFKVVLGAQARFDVGLYFATDGDTDGNGALVGVCDANIVGPKTPPPPPQYGSDFFTQLDPAPDSCGDIDGNHPTQMVTVLVNNVLCNDSDGDGTLNLPNCTSWRTSGNNTTCQTSFDAYPGSPSKCNCDIGFNVPIFVEVGSLTVTKSANPTSRPEPGGAFTFTVNTKNDADFTSVTLNQICDDKYGTVKDVAVPSTCPAGTLGTIGSTTCSLPQTLAPGASYECAFTGNVFSNVPTSSTDVVKVSGVDQNGKPVSDTASAQVAITDVPPTAMVTKSMNGVTCADVSYHVKVQNTDAAETLSLTALTDDGFGSLTSVHDSVLSTTCAAPQTIAKGGAYECDFTAHFCGSPHTDTVTASLHDDENNALSQTSNMLTVTISGAVQP